jgi:hypothetical protein
MKEENLFERVQNGARRRMSWRKAKTSNLFIQSEVLAKGHVIHARHQKIPLEQDTVMVFADDAPGYNWSHPCRYLLHNAENGELYKEVAAAFPPYLIEPPETFQVFYEPGVRLAEERLLWPIKAEARLVWRVPVGNRYAVLFSGGSNPRHVNDLEFLYRTLVDVYGFPTEQIYVLNYDGTLDCWPSLPANWPGDGTAYRMPVHGRGTKSELEGVFNDLKTRLKSDDLLLIHTNNHGGHDGTESYLCGYDSPGYIGADDYMASDFATKLGELPQFRCLIVMMEQCHSGGFNAPILASNPADRTSVASACGELVSSWGCGDFDCFARDWIAAVNGADPYGAALASNPDTDGNGCISASEAFNYADAIHDPRDSPMFSATPADGGSCHLGQIYAGVLLPWWYYQLVYERLWPWWVELPDPIFYERFHKELVPRLKEMDEYVQKRSEELQRELEPQIEKLIEGAMG